MASYARLWLRLLWTGRTLIGAPFFIFSLWQASKDEVPAEWQEKPLFDRLSALPFDWYVWCIIGLIVVMAAIVHGCWTLLADQINAERSLSHRMYKFAPRATMSGIEIVMNLPSVMTQGFTHELLVDSMRIVLDREFGMDCPKDIVEKRMREFIQQLQACELVTVEYRPTDAPPTHIMAHNYYGMTVAGARFMTRPASRQSVLRDSAPRPPVAP